MKNFGMKSDNNIRPRRLRPRHETNFPNSHQVDQRYEVRDNSCIRVLMRHGGDKNERQHWNHCGSGLYQMEEHTRRRLNTNRHAVWIASDTLVGGK